MNDFATLEKTIVRELSCRLCLCNDVIKLKPLSAEVKRKIKKLYDIVIHTDDCLPKAICHDCLQQISNAYIYAVKVERTQKFLEFHRNKKNEDKQPNEIKNYSLINELSARNLEHASTELKTVSNSTTPPKPAEITTTELQQGDTKLAKPKQVKKQSPSDMKYLEAMPLEEFAEVEKLDKSLLNSTTSANKSPSPTHEKRIVEDELEQDVLDPIVIIDGRPAKQGHALDMQITLFYKMECCICHETGFHFRSLMKHYKDRHGVPGYVTCCDKKFHYFYPKKIIEHMAFHLQPNIFMCKSCHQNFQTSQELTEHQTNGGRSEGKILCPRCSERYPTYRELGAHLLTHRADKLQCDYCGKTLKHHHRKKTVNHMEDVILCSQCVRTLKNIEKQERDIKEKVKAKSVDTLTLQKYQKFRQAMGLSADEEASSD
ncbi:zinc finger protein weckle-like isoform X1 [Pieris brassicae]|uniref:zinc finger protein weckle-like isoform X1 n=1 Tax=Pieris brassicae TaxID=7116 RepID=UPI001E660B58|nr:zinc finger protein weckle-like isoform X1 [Pieris brassicae]